jgi:hypothetical protein
MAALSTIAAIAAIGAAVAGTARTLTAKPAKQPDVPQLPAAPQLDTGAMQEAARRRRTALMRGEAPPTRGQTLLTGALGAPPTSRTTLLGM